MRGPKRGATFPLEPTSINQGFFLLWSKSPCYSMYNEKMYAYIAFPKPCEVLALITISCLSR